MDSSVPPIVYTNNPADNFFRKRHTATVSFAIGLLLFLLPFAELKCGSTTLAANTGIGIALGKEWKVVMMGNDNDWMKKANSSVKEGKTNPMKSGPDVFAILAIASGLWGLIFSLSHQKQRSLMAICAGILAGIMLIAIMIRFKMILHSSLNEGNDNKVDMGMLIKINFTVWFYMSLIAFAAAAFFGYKHQKIELQDDIDKVVDFDFQQKSE